MQEEGHRPSCRYGDRGGTRSGGSSGGEQRLVDELCAPGGMRAAPDPEDLRLFVESASSMDGLRVGELLIEKMVGGSS